MSRPATLLRALPVLLALSALAAPCRAQGDLSAVTIRAVPVRGTVSMLEGAGGNIGVSAGPDGILIVDDQFAPLSERIEAALEALGGSGRLRWVLNTHWHGDHTGGNARFGRIAPILAHENVRRRLAREETLFGQRTGPQPAEALPVVTYDGSLSVHFNGEEIRMVHLPGGHTDGDSIVFFTRSNVVHLGDLMFSGLFPFIDLDHGGDVERYIRNVERALSMIPDDAKIIPGHGPVSTPRDLRAFHAMLLETTSIVRARVREGATLEQARKAGLPAAWEPWGKGFVSADLWIETVWRSLTRPRGE